ncbi:MAG: FtsH protease activity modulator HflK [Alphaproteobacteria bacterium]|nr:FtsH protease activity modulator HflK [Alphaproteobacteria bacterium]
MPLDNDGNGDDNTPKGPVKGPWGGNSNKSRRPTEESAKDSQKKENPSPNPWSRRESPGSGNGNSIDDLIDVIQDRVRKMMTGGGGPKSGGFNNGGKSKGNFGLFVLMGLGAFVLWLGTGLYRVQEGEVGVVLRFGEMVRTSLPGLQYHFPAPFESVIVQKIAVLNTIDGGLKTEKNGDSAEATLILTGDENMVHTNYTVLWKIKDVSEYLFTARNPDETIRVAAESVVREVIGQTTARLALTEGRGQIETRAQEILQKLLDQYKMGIQIVSIQLQNVAPPHQVVDAFNDLQASLVNADQSRNEAEAYKNEIIPRAQGQAAQIGNEATAYSQRKIAEAEGEAGRFLQVLVAYEAHPNITLKRYYLETMQSVLSKATKIILDEKVGKGILPYLPLNELKGHLSDSAAAKKGGSK